MMTNQMLLTRMLISTLVAILVACSSSNSTPPKIWGTAELIETEDFGNVASASSVVDSAGNVTVVWEQSDGTRDNLWANRYDAADGTWGTAEKIETEDLDDVSFDQLVIDTNGNVTAEWRQYDGLWQNLWANRYDAASGTWGTAEKIETEDLGNVQSGMNLIVDGVGNVTAVWSQRDGTRDNLWANRYTVGSGWGTAMKIDNEDLGSAFIARVVIDSNGNVTAVWTQSDGMRGNVWTNRYTVGSGWGTAGKIEIEDLGGAVTPQVIVDGTGNVIAVWRQENGVRGNLWANRYAVGSSNWGAAEEIETEDLGTAFSAQLIIDATGNVTATWTQNDGTRDNLWSNRYTVGSGWGIAEKIETEDLGGVVFSFKQSIDTAGNVTVVWPQNDGTRNNLWANRYVVAGSNWGTAEKIESEDLADATPISLIIDSKGNTTTTWTQSDGVQLNLWANRYDAADGTWGMAEKIESEDAGAFTGVFSAEIVLDNTDNLMAVWSQNDGTRSNLWANRYTAGSGWGTAEKIETEDLDAASSPVLAIDGSGNVTAVWEQSDGTRNNLWANSFR